MTDPAGDFWMPEECTYSSSCSCGYSPPCIREDVEKDAGECHTSNGN